MFDEDHSGDIDKREFNKLINTLGLELNDKRQLELMKEIPRKKLAEFILKELNTGKYEELTEWLNG